jgi:hypothetical protein
MNKRLDDYGITFERVGEDAYYAYANVVMDGIAFDRVDEATEYRDMDSMELRVVKNEKGVEEHLLLSKERDISSLCKVH